MHALLAAIVAISVLVCLSRLVSAGLTCDSRSPLCLEPKGQFPVPNECRKFANCWDNCATYSSCPGTLVFSEEQRRCDFTWNVKPDSPCYKPMANAGGVAGSGGLPDLQSLQPLPALNPLFAAPPPATFAPMFGGAMQQGQNQDGSFFQSMNQQQQRNAF